MGEQVGARSKKKITGESLIRYLVFTIVFGMGTGVAPERIATKSFRLLDNPTIDNSKNSLLFSSVLVGLFQTKESISSLERR